MNLASTFSSIESCLVKIGGFLQPVILLLLRLWWGWSFARTGLGKLRNLDKTTEFFASLNLPLPKLNAILAGGTECLGGALLLLGLCTRFASVPLIFTMLVAYATADKEALAAIFSDTDKFVSAAPFPSPAGSRGSPRTSRPGRCAGCCCT